MHFHVQSVIQDVWGVRIITFLDPIESPRRQTRTKQKNNYYDLRIFCQVIVTMVNVEMTNAWLLNNARNANNRARAEAVRRSRAEAAEERAKAKAKKAAEAAKKEMNTARKAAEAAEKEMNTARKAAVERSAAEAAAARAARAASRGETSNRRNKTNTANKAAKKAAENAKKAAENAKKAQANAEKAAVNAKKAQANALIQNVKKNWINVAASTMSRNDKQKKGGKIYKKASLKLHPNKPTGNTESFQLLSTLFEEFTVYVNQN